MRQILFALAVALTWSMTTAPLSAADPFSGKSPETMADKLPRPDAQADAAASAQVRKQFAAQYAQATSAEDRSRLAQQMLAAAQRESQPAVKFVLLRVARDTAALAEDVSTALAAADATSEQYDVDSIDWTGYALFKLGKSQDTKVRAEVATAAIALADEALSGNNVKSAKILLGIAHDCTPPANITMHKKIAEVSRRIESGEVASTGDPEGEKSAASDSAPAAEAVSVGPPPEKQADYLQSVRWNGPATTLEALQGKTVLILTYVTWCPKCNVWSPTLTAQIKEATREKPIVVLAISTATPTVPGYEYMKKLDFLADNILHGHDDTINAKLGVDGLFNYAWIDGEGKIVEKGEAGRYYPGKDGQPDEFVVARKLQEANDPGKFQYVKDDAPADLKPLLWQLETGQGISPGDWAAAKRELPREEFSQLEGAVATFLARQTQIVDLFAEGDVADRLLAHEKATQLTGTFRGYPQIQDLRKAVAKLARDSAFKRELLARDQFDRALTQAAARPGQRNQLLTLVAGQFSGTYYGDLAAKIAQAR